MALQLNTSTSIVDFLKSQNKASDYTSRQSLYNSLGLNERLGDYVSSGSQNIAFLKALNTPTQTQTVQPTGTSIGSFQGVPIYPGDVQAQVNQIRQPATTPTTAPAPAPTPTAPSTLGTSGLTATQAAASIPKAPSAEEVLNTVLNSSGFQNFQQRQSANTLYATGEAEAQKALLESKSAAATKDFINQMGRRGLFFSGETEGGIQALAESLATSKLGVDRALAKDLLEADFDTRDEILKQVEGIVKDAQQGRKEAISALEKVGLTVIGDQVVPTLAARNAELAEANRQADNQRQDINQAIALEKLDLSEQAAQRAESYLRLAEERAARAEGGDGDITLSNSDKASIKLYGSVIDEELSLGGTAYDALQSAIIEAAATNSTLSQTNQAALLDYANKRATELKTQIQEEQSASTAEQAVFANPIEGVIASLSKSGILTKADIRAALRNRGFTDAEINASSLGGGLTGTLSQFGNFLGGLKF